MLKERQEDMTPLDIKKYPDKVLRKECEPVGRLTDEERKIFDEMLFTMRHFYGIGLAAPQIGISRKLIVADVEGSVVKLADPKIIEASGADNMKEGCLSVPGISVDVKRPYKIAVTGLDVHGEPVRIEAEGLLARVIQHEVDHLKGRIILDYMGAFERLKFKLNSRKR